jgi:hypothetical protein
MMNTRVSWQSLAGVDLMAALDLAVEVEEEEIVLERLAPIDSQDQLWLYRDLREVVACRGLEVQLAVLLEVWQDLFLPVQDLVDQGLGQVVVAVPLLEVFLVDLGWGLLGVWEACHKPKVLATRFQVVQKENSTRTTMLIFMLAICQAQWMMRVLFDCFSPSDKWKMRRLSRIV